MPLPVAVTCTEKVVVCALTVRKTFAEAPGVRRRLYLSRESVTHGIHVDSWRATVPLKLLLVTVICVVFDTPVAIVREAGFASIVKSGAGVTKITMLTEWESVPIVVE